MWPVLSQLLLVFWFKYQIWNTIITSLPFCFCFACCNSTSLQWLSGCHFHEVVVGYFCGYHSKSHISVISCSFFSLSSLKSSHRCRCHRVVFFFKCEWIHLNNGWSRMWWSAKQVPVLDDRRSDMSRRNKLLLRKQVLVWSVTFLLTLLMLKSRTVYVKRLQR